MVQSKEQSPKDIFFEDIELVARLKLKGVTPLSLSQEGNHQGAQVLRFAIGRLDKNKLMGSVDKRVKEIKKEQLQTEKKVSTPKKQKTAKIPRQLSLEQAHPEGHAGMWGKDSLKSEGSEILDPEAGIVAMHDPIKRQKIMVRVVDHEWRKKLKSWGYTQANRTKKLEKAKRKAIKRLKKAGVWEKVLKTSTPEEREEIKQTLEDYKEPTRDLNSSTGITIYPNEASWWRDIHGKNL